MNRLLHILLVQALVVSSWGQEAPVFHPPLKIPMVLSGNFGEIRSDHFHSGIDIKTRGSTGHQVFAVEEGYVSRIKVQANGYGKSIYIAHPNGYTSVYGHLEAYRDDIAQFVRQQQYRKKAHQVDLYLDKHTFRVSKGEFIAYSGNTGSSSGPHLHFEIRNSANQHPTNVLKYNFQIADHLAPRFKTLVLYPIKGEGSVKRNPESQIINLVKDKGQYTIPWGTQLEASGAIGIGLEVYDYLDGAANRCGIYSLDLYLDGQLIYGHIMNEFAFSESRYINAHICYEEGIRKGIRAHRLHKLPHNQLRIYRKDAANRAPVLNENKDYHFKAVATDVAGNTSILKFRVRGKVADEFPLHYAEDYIKTMSWEERNQYKYEGLLVDIPSRALYQDLDFSFSTSPASAASLSPFYHIASEETPLQRSYTLSIPVGEIDPGLYPKLLLITPDEKEGVLAAGGAYQAGSVVASLNSFGSFALGLDTVAPEISPIGRDIQGDLSQLKAIRFHVSDDLSGIDRYEGYIDNQWVLFEYDPKNDLISYTMDRERLSSGRKHELELYVSDAKGNTKLYHTTFTW